jgi:hypothetical protein
MVRRDVAGREPCGSGTEVGTGPLRTTTVGSQLQHIQTDDYHINSDEIPTNSTTITAPQRNRWPFGKTFRQQIQSIGSQHFPIYPSSLTVGQCRTIHQRLRPKRVAAAYGHTPSVAQTGRRAYIGSLREQISRPITTRAASPIPLQDYFTDLWPRVQHKPGRSHDFPVFPLSTRRAECNALNGYDTATCWPCGEPVA